MSMVCLDEAWDQPSSSINNLEKGIITLAPDPNTGKFVITLPGPGLEGFILKVWTTTGACKFSKEVPSGDRINTIRVDLDHPSAGIYILELSSAGMKVVRKFVIN